MCFSATASFGSAALLFSIGTATAVINRSKSHRMFVAIPFLFGAQQAAEGLVWLSFGQNIPSAYTQSAILFFLFIAHGVWPFWVPRSILKIETDETRRRLLFAIQGIGIFGLIFASAVLFAGTSRASISGHSVVYSISNPFDFLHPNIEALLYTATTVMPFFISSLRLVKTMGALVVMGLLTTLIMNQQAVTSVWCFFAAAISFYISIQIYQREKRMIPVYSKY